jgi:nucleotide-binding universal stress UspA family protein
MKIVVGYDGSAGAKRALERAAELGRNGDPITVISVVELHASTGRGPGAAGQMSAAERRQELREATEFLEGKGLEVRSVEGHGSPAQTIAEEAEESGADLIVVGTHGRGAVARAVVGSVSTKLVHDAPCDVLVVR